MRSTHHERDLGHERDLSGLVARMGILDRGRGADVPEKSPKRETAPPRGVITDQKLLTYFFRELCGQDVQPITTDQFTEKSKAQYGAAWLAREIIQNWVDHNPGGNRGTINGVDIKEENMRASTQMPNGGKRFTIEGHWPLQDITGIIGLHSEKPTEGQSAGGNGIGLKQAALRYLRDFRVQKFEVRGEGWVVNYRLAKKNAVNAEMSTRLAERNACPVGVVKHDWLIAEIDEVAESKGKCVYVIETDDPEIIATLEDLHTIGVSEDNPYLENPDFSNELGTIKWLHLDKKGREPKGRLFINGQVMGYREKGKREADYWQGPELATIALRDVKYDMNIDRPPVSPIDLGRYVDSLLNSMTKSELIEQLKLSAHIWGGGISEGSYMEKKGCYVLIEAMARALLYGLHKGGQLGSWQPSEFSKHFGDKKYLARSVRLSDAQEEDLRSRGFILCPEFFASIGMPKASTELSSAETAKTRQPRSVGSQLDKLAESDGLPVNYQELDDYRGKPDKFFRLLRSKLSAVGLKVEKMGDRTYKLSTNLSVSKEILFNQLHKPKKGDAAQETLFFLRGAILHGLKEQLFESVSSSQGAYVTTYANTFDLTTEQHGLLVLNSPAKTEEGLAIEITFTAPNERDFEKALSGQPDAVEEVISSKDHSQAGIISSESPIGLDLGMVQRRRREEEEGERVKQLRASLGIGQNGAEDDRLVGKKSRRIAKRRSLPAEDKAQIEALGRSFPELASAVRQVTSAINEAVKAADAAEGDTTKKSIIEKVLHWKTNSDIYGQFGKESGYLGGKTLGEIVEDNSQADIPVVEQTGEISQTERAVKRISTRLKSIANAMLPLEEQLDEFEIVVEPTREQMALLGILRRYTVLTTGYDFENDLFLYEGTGTKGINVVRKAIGIHVELLKVDFKEAVSTLVHEVAHNGSMQHGVKFMHTMQALFSEQNSRLDDIGKRLIKKEGITDEEKTILDLKRRWDEMRIVYMGSKDK